MLSASTRSCRCVRGTRFGRPLDPDEYWKTASASGVLASSGTLGCPSMTRSSGTTSPSRTTSAPSSPCLTMALTPASSKWKSNSASLNCGFRGTTTPPSRATAKNVTTNSGTFGSTSATGSPGPSPSDASPWASRLARSRTSGQPIRWAPYTRPPASAASSIEVSGAVPGWSSASIVSGCRGEGGVLERRLGVCPAVDGLHQRACLEQRLLVLGLGIGLHDDRTAGPDGRRLAVHDDRPDHDVEVGRAAQAEVADRARVDAAGLPLELVDDLHRALLRRAGHRAAG